MKINKKKKTEEPEMISANTSEADEKSGRKPVPEHWTTKIKFPRRFMLFIDVLCALIGIVAIFLLMRFMINEVYKRNYLNGNYDYTKESQLMRLNYPEGYVPYYNIGNAAFQTEDFDTAIACYSNALNYTGIPEQKECAIRINLALALLRKIDPEKLTTEKRIQNTLSQLYAARNLLCEKGCAHMDDEDGHNPIAQQLKDEIDEMIKELEEQLQDNDPQTENSPDGGDSNEDQKDQGEEDDKKKSAREKQIEKELEEQRRENMEERSDVHQNFEEEDSINGSNWEEDYGKNW